MNRRSFLKASALSSMGLACATAWGDQFPAQTAAKPPSLTVKTGGVQMIPIDGGKFRVWTKKVGGGGGGRSTKMLTLHGGPGVTHEYFECFEDFLPQEGVEVYYYDQLGSSYSDQPDDPSLWTMPRFVEEVEQVRSALGLENFYLFGHSWGGMLGIDYALKYGRHLKGFVLSDMTASIPAYEKYVAKLRAALPAEVIATLDKYEGKNDYDNPEYQRVMIEGVYARHLCRLPEWPEPFARSFRHLNTQVYKTMQGPNEFIFTGNLKRWDRWADLPKITVPTLVLGGRHGTMSPDDLRREAELIPNARLAICERGSHLSMYDDQQSYFEYLTTFLKDNERGVKMKA